MRLKRIGCGFIALVLSLSFSMPISSYASGNFPDTTGHWAERYISRVFSQKIVDGYPNGRFLPDKSVTRAEFVSMVNKAIKLDRSASSNFSDVAGGQWYYNDISDAVSSTYAGGYSDNTFRPNSPITRQEAAVMISRILPNYKKGGNLKSYRDYKQVDSWAVTALEKLIGKQYMGAYDDGKLHPKDPLTRAQTAKILCEILDNETIVTRDTYIDEDKTVLTDKIYVNDVYIDEDLGEGNATIENCVILGDLIVEGGGSKSVTINNTRIASAVVRKDDSPVRIVTKGQTTISRLTAKQSSIIQSAGKDGYGILNIEVSKGADLTLKGDFPIVNLVGSAATVSLQSGKIAALTVTKTAKYSDVTLTGKAEITEATVNAEAYFHGTGTVTHMIVNADDITYETKPVKMTVGVDIDRATGEGDSNSDVEVEFEPDKKDTDIRLDTKITITFDSSMKLADGKAITSANIKNFVDLRKGTKSGDVVDYTATINSANKVITLTPKSDLSANTTYYVIVAKRTLKNAGGSENDEEYIYFTTGTKGGSSTASFSPSDGASGVAVNPSITISFSDDVVKFSDGGNVTDSYLTECVQFKKDSASGASVDFKATISSSDKITITPTSALTVGQKYYVAIVADKLKSKENGKAISAASSTWTVGTVSTPAATPVLSNFKLTPAENSIKVEYLPNVSGTVYALATTSSHVTDTQILAGKSGAATAGTAGDLTITGLTANTTYYVYALLKNASSTPSAIVSGSTKTTIVDAKLQTLTVTPSGESSSVLTGFSPATNTYTVHVPYGTTAVDVAATAETSAISPVISATINNAVTSLTGIPVSGSSANKITITVGAANKTTGTYVINVTVKGNTDLDNISVNGGAPSQINSAYASYVSASATSATVSVSTVDTTATITIGGVSQTGTWTGSVNLGTGNPTVSFTVTSNGQTKTYSIQFFRN